MYVINMSTTAHSPRVGPSLLACIVGAGLGLMLSSATDGLTSVKSPEHRAAMQVVATSSIDR